MINPKNLLFGIIFLFSLLSLMSISALTLEQNVDSLISFPCTYNGTNCPAATECNLSVIYPNQSLMVENDNASYSGSGIAQYPIPDNSINGDYKVPLTCTFPDGVSEEGNADFSITPNGEEPNLSQTFIYLGLILIILVLFILCVWGLSEIDSIGWKVGLIAISYILLNGFLLMCWKLAELFLTSVPFIEPVFRVLYIASNVGYFVMFLALVSYLLFKLTDEKTMKTLVARGYDEDSAKRIMARRRR